MSTIIFNPGHRAVLDTMLLHLPGVTAGKMFGYPAYFVDKKLFACVYGDGIGIKLPEETVNRLLGKAHVVPFQPMGKPKMREWVQINRESSEDYRLDQEIFHHAVQFVGTLKKK